MAWPTQDERLMNPMGHTAKKSPPMPMMPANKTAMKGRALAKAIRTKK